MRCVALAEGLLARGVAATVLMTDNTTHDGELEPLRRAVPVERIKAAGLEQDAVETTEAARRLGASAILTDVCSQRNLAQRDRLDAYHRRLRDEIPFLMVFAGGFHIDASADVVVNPYLLPREQATGASASEPRVLWGPEYFIFRSEFVAAAAQPRAIVPRVERIGVVVGGSDPAGLTLRIVNALAGVAGRDAEVRVVLPPGMARTAREQVTAALDASGDNWTAIGPPGDMAAFFRWCDLAITGDGLTKYETAVTGTPSIIVARPDSNPRINAEFAAGGSTVCVEPGADHAWAGLAPAIADLLDNQPARQAMCRRGRELVDGRGLDRVLARIPLVSVA